METNFGLKRVKLVNDQQEKGAPVLNTGCEASVPNSGVVPKASPRGGVKLTFVLRFTGGFLFSPANFGKTYFYWKRTRSQKKRASLAWVVGSKKL
jgi:hypothetical protein